MTFDWFRRRHISPDPDAGSPSSDSTPETSEEIRSSVPVSDYLAFAKAAYANLKAQEMGERSVSANTSSPGEEVSTSPLSAENAVESQPLEEEASSSRPKAFFELATKASSRLEVLEATALVEPEPEVADPPEALPFDLGFQWSSEILAAQGRRPEDISVEEITWLKKLQKGLGRTRLSLINQLKALVGRGPIDQEAVEEIETLLLQADVGVDATDEILTALQKRMRQEVLPPEEAVKYLREQMQGILNIGQTTFAPQRNQLNIWLIVGVNGVGKTTTIGKISHIAQKSGYRCLIAAADTFRAAAVEQLRVWGERSGVEVIANPTQNADPAAVVFDAITAAQSREVELLLVDTAGRLQNKKNLMEELSKIRRIIDKKAPGARVEALLVLDATLGQNGLKQAEVFAEAAKLSGVVLTKLDGTAKGGIAFAITQQLKLPIRFIGAGEGIEDLRPFSSYEFVAALLSDF
jgi:fused signal recognition particle receptor